MNAYEQKIAARKERLEARAAKARAEGSSRIAHADKIASMIPLGQPILIGHHSERRHRRDAERIRNGLDKGFEALKAADELERRAASVGTGGVSSDDPDALVKLRERLVEAEKAHEMEKKANAVWRKHGRGSDVLVDKLRDIGFSDKDIARQASTMAIVGHLDAPFHLSNNTAEIRRLKERIVRLEAAPAVAESFEPIEGKGYRIEARPEINRVSLTLDNRIGTEAFKQILRSGWKWSPREQAFLRHLTTAAGTLRHNSYPITAARSVLDAL